MNKTITSIFFDAQAVRLTVNYNVTEDGAVKYRTAIFIREGDFIPPQPFPGTPPAIIVLAQREASALVGILQYLESAKGNLP